MKRYLIPTTHNNWRPNLLRGKTVLTVSLLVIALLGISYIHLSYLGYGFNQVAAVLPSVLYEEANRERARNDQFALLVDPELEESARLKAEHMIENEYFDHYAPDGTTPWDFFREAGYEFSYAGENLAINFVDSTDITRAWMNSPSHRANMLSGRYHEIGIAAIEGKYKGRKTIFVVEHFGTPLYEDEAFQTPREPRELTASVGNIESRLLEDPLLIYRALLALIAAFVAYALFRSIKHEKTRRDHMTSIGYGVLLFLLIAGVAYTMNVIVLTNGVIL